MASTKAQDPLDALQSLINDVLIQTGKALRASRRDSQGNLPLSYMQPKLPDTISAFHSALDTLENGIIRAKSVLLRDLDQLKIQDNSAQGSQSLIHPQPVNAQLKPSMAIEIGSSPQEVVPKEEPIDSNITATQPAAPFPDMGMGMADSTGTSITVKENGPIRLPTTADTEGTNKLKTDLKQPTHAAPIPLMDPKPENLPAGFPGGDEVLDLASSGLNFTDMEFTLAPSNDNLTQPGHDGAVTNITNGHPLDLSSFGTTDGATATMALENSTPSNTVDQPTAAPPTSTSVSGNPKNSEGQKKQEGTETAFADIFASDGRADGMDFDFSIGDGMGGDTFDDLMNDRDNAFDTMEHGDFDTTFFGLDKADEA